MNEMRIFSIVIDCSDSPTLSTFYAKLLGWTKHDEQPEHISVSKEGVYPFLLFQQIDDYKPPVWPENPHDQRQMIHLDFVVTDIREAIGHAESCGAVKAPVQYSDRWTVLFDPQGHPFCLCQR